MVRRRSHRDRARLKTSGTRVRIVLALCLAIAIAPMKFYMVREFLGVLLLVAAATSTILMFSVALVLSQEGLLWAILCTKTGVARFARFARVSPEAPNLRRR